MFQERRCFNFRFSVVFSAAIGLALVTPALQKGTNGVTEVAQQSTSSTTVVRLFRADVPEAELIELRRRIRATNWPEVRSLRPA